MRTAKLGLRADVQPSGRIISKNIQMECSSAVYLKKRVERRGQVMNIQIPEERGREREM